MSNIQTTLPNNDFRDILIKFDMMSETGESPGLVFVGRDISDRHEFIALEYAKKYGANAVYFRRFDDGRPPIPQIYIYDFTENKNDDFEIADLYKKLWNSGQVPLFFIFYKTEVKIFSCLKNPGFDPSTGKISYTIFETIKLASTFKKETDKIKDFSAKRFDNGSFWTNPKYKNKFKLKETVYLKLLNELKRLRKDIIQSGILEDNIAQRLLVMSILVKYLEEREDENGTTVFPDGFFRKFSEGDDFISVLKTKGACLELFDYLGSEERFNGEIFKWQDKKEREILKTTDLKDFAVFFEGRLDERQYTFWRLYSFNDLPIELISNIYEEFLESKEKGVVYTPPYLVNFLLDEQMPLSDFHKTDFKVIDPACGSGVFLVAAFRRMIHWWRRRNNWKKPDAENLEELKKILKNNIFGVDKYEEAVRLTFFSLSLALLDELSPKVIWENLKFDDLLQSNLISKDFFELINDGFFQAEFDLVIGNPPFVSELTPAAERIEKQKTNNKRPKLPDNQIALLFLEQAMELSKKGASICLIMPSGPLLYNNNSVEFRNYILSTYHVPQIIDFTSLSAILFESANVAVAVVFAKKQDPTQKDLLHVTVRRTKPVKEKLYFELDYYDFHKISYHDALENRLIWKSNLLGGGRLKHLMARFAHIRSFSEYLKDAENKYGWKIAEGFIVGNKREITELIYLKENITQLSLKEKERLKKLEKKYKKAEYITGKNTLPTDAFTEKGIDETRIHVLEEKYFIRNREKNKSIYKGPHLLIKEGVAKNSIPIAFRDDDLSFKHRIIGIHSPKNHSNELLEIENRIKNNRTYLFYVAGFSGEYMIGRATSILKRDIEFLPYPEDERELELTEIEQILVDDVLDYMLDFRSKGEKSAAEKPVDNGQLNQFSEIYCRVLNSVYKEFKPYKPLKTDSFICFPFYYRDKPQIIEDSMDELEDALYELIQNNTNTNSRIVRMLRMYENNTIYLIKPKQTRYWLRSVAIRDADETFADLVVQGY
jgi:Eco57I restriction-modification methylase